MRPIVENCAGMRVVIGRLEAGLRDAWDPREALAQAFELVIPICLITLERVGLIIGQWTNVFFQLRVQRLSSWHRCPAHEYREHLHFTVELSLNRDLHFSPDKVHFRAGDPIIESLQPIRADDDQHYLGPSDSLSYVFREHIAGVQGVDIEEDVVIAEPESQPVK